MTKTSNHLISLGEKVKLKRQELGYTQQKLADLLGYSTRGAITRIEKGERDLPIDKLKILAKVLHTTPEYLLDWDTPNTKAENKDNENNVYNYDISTLTVQEKSELEALLTITQTMFLKNGKISDEDMEKIKQSLTESFFETIHNKKK